MKNATIAAAILFAVSISSCGSCGSGTTTEDEALLAQLDSLGNETALQVEMIEEDKKPVVSTASVTTECYSDNGKDFLPKSVTFDLTSTTFTVKTGNNSIPYKINSEIRRGESVTTFSCYTALNEWYSDASIERLLVKVYYNADGTIKSVSLNGRIFYTEVPALEFGQVYIVRKGDNLAVLSQKLNMTQEEIRAQIGIPKVGDKIKLK